MVEMADMVVKGAMAVAAYQESVSLANIALAETVAMADSVRMVGTEEREREEAWVVQAGSAMVAVSM
jgi:hypothetical protein